MAVSHTLEEVVDLQITKVFRLVERLYALALEESELDSDSRDKIERLAARVANIASAHDLEQTEIHALKLKRDAPSVGREAIDVHTENIREALHRELGRTRVLLLREPYADWYKHAQHKSGDRLVKDALPELWPDYREACYCYACEHFGATQLLLCRALEIALHRLAEMPDINVHVTEKRNALGEGRIKDWLVISEQVEAKLNHRSKQGVTSPSELVLSNKYSLLVMFLSSARGAWRNATMHPDRDNLMQRTDRERLEESTTELLQATTTFLKAFARVVNS